MSISEFIYSWIKDLVLLFIIITLVDLIMPKGSMRRYINFVVGLLIIFTVINPFINLVNVDFQLEKEVFRNIDSKFKYDEEILDRQDEQIESIYKEKIAREVKTFVEGNTEYKISILNVEIDKTEENFGAISYLDLVILDQDVEMDENNISVQVKPVVLEYRPKIEENENFLDIKELISNRYEIGKDLINVSINKLED
ncbi:MAG: stage III sporulation protein AF [Tissierellaceae bacterium]|nr:stage III sporulation protein AF [Tissierellaceae bacterium]